MSRIESDVIPIATPLILGRQCRVTEEGQRKPAAFLCLVSMRTEYLGELRAIPPEDRRYLMEHFEPPALWFVWIARYAGNKPDEHWSRYCGMQLCSEGTGPVSEVGPEHCNTQVTTMVLGKLCTHVFSSTETPVLGYEGIRMTRIWPQSGFVIDTRFLPTWDDAAVLWLHEALARESTPLPSPQTRGVNTDERRDPQIKG